MSHMHHARFWIAAAIIALAIAAGFLLSVPHTRDIVPSTTPLAQATTTPSVILHDVFKKGVHTITGSLEASNACATVAAQASLESDAAGAESIRVALSLESDTGVCLQLPTRVNFSTTLTAPAKIPMTATVNGSPATTTSS
jgi:hypothetical protein